jgi:predicted phosphate transport protein (TIGR00153 family)
MASLIGRNKRENRFVGLLRQQAAKGQEGVAALSRYLADRDEEAAEQLERCEKEADELRRVLIDELHKTFVTPFDREDIFDLSLYLDDVLDYAYDTVEEMRALRVEPDGYLVEMARRLGEATDELLLAMERLEDNPMVAMDHARRTKHRENQIEKVYRKAIADLFDTAHDTDDVLRMLRIREVYRHVNNAADRADMAANVIGAAIVKMT